MLNMDGIGRLNKQVEVFQYKDEKKDGITKQVLVRAIPNRIWARIEPLRGRQYMEVYKEKLEEVHKITIRYRKGITAGMLIKYQDTTYKINTVVDPYMGHVKLELMCSIHTEGKKK